MRRGWQHAAAASWSSHAGTTLPASNFCSRGRHVESLSACGQQVVQPHVASRAARRSLAAELNAMSRSQIWDTITARNHRGVGVPVLNPGHTAQSKTVWHGAHSLPSDMRSKPVPVGRGPVAAGSCTAFRPTNHAAEAAKSFLTRLRFLCAADAWTAACLGCAAAACFPPLPSSMCGCVCPRAACDELESGRHVPQYIADACALETSGQRIAHLALGTSLYSHETPSINDLRRAYTSRASCGWRVTDAPGGNHSHASYDIDRIDLSGYFRY
eukprot:SAG31_NODE_3599_length_4085_cov_4.147516_1_plen_271_part_00